MADTDVSSLAAARRQVQACRRCPLYANATQAVFGAGPASAPLMMVGEQPGDQEDRDGKPFVGPAGRVLDAVLIEVGIDRSKVYVTNAVKHFKFAPRGKRRLHRKPDASEISACGFWLEAERKLVKPEVIVALGGTAARSLFGKSVTISRLRDTPTEMDDGTLLFVTVHPSYLLRIRDREKARRERAAFARDLGVVRDHMEKLPAARVALDSPNAGP